MGSARPGRTDPDRTGEAAGAEEEHPLSRALPIFLIAPLVAALGGASVHAGTVRPPFQQAEAQKPEAEFSRLAAQLSGQRLDGVDISEKQQEQALGILDQVVLEALNAGGEPALEGMNQRLAGLVSQQPPVGESYRALKLGGKPAPYALVANFGLGGPSAVRLYAGVAGRYALAARIDRFTQKDFFDEYLEIVPVTAPVTLFVTVTGRTDDLQTGAFAVWRFEGGRLQAVWSSEILQQSSYEAREDGFRLTYCAETDENNPRLCKRMVRDRYVWDGGAWKRAEQAAAPAPKPRR